MTGHAAVNSQRPSTLGFTLVKRFEKGKICLTSEHGTWENCSGFFKGANL